MSEIISKSQDRIEGCEREKVRLRRHSIVFLKRDKVGAITNAKTKRKRVGDTLSIG